MPLFRLLAASLIALALLPLDESRAQETETEVVAGIAVRAPRARSFILRATIPLPRGELAPGEETVPFGVVSHAQGRPVVPAQVEGVSRYPNGDWDVVQILARVQREEEVKPGTELRFDVVRAPHPRARPHRPGAVLRELLKRKQRLVLRCRDVYGNLYSLDLLSNPKDPGFGSLTRRKAGRWLTQFRVAGVMLPVPEPGAPPHPGPPLSHMCGALAWFSDYAGEDCLSLDLRLHNGLVAGARKALPGEQPVGAIYWQSMELLVPKGLSVVPDVRDPFFGTPYLEEGWKVYPLVAPYEDGQLHLMGPQAQFVRRLALVPEGAEVAARARLSLAGLGFCAGESDAWSWSNPATARYFPQRELLPWFDFYRYQKASGRRALWQHESARAKELAAQLQSGRAGPYPRKSPVLGWAHPYFISIEGGTGGEEISLVEGHRAVGGIARESLRRSQLVHRMNTSRQPQATWDRAGRPVGFFEWSREENGDRRIDFHYCNFGRGVIPVFILPCAGGPPASEQVAEVAKLGLRPPYDGGTPFVAGGKLPAEDRHLLTWAPHDGDHMIRYTKELKALVWLDDDALAKDDLRLGAELFRLYFHEARGPSSWRAGGTLRGVEQLAERHPRQGLPISRNNAWGIDLFCAYYSTAEDEWRNRNREWAERVADLLVAGATPGGVIIRSGYPPLLQNPKYVGAHAFQSEFLLLAQRSLAESVFRGVDGQRTKALEELFVRTVEYLFWGPVWKRLKVPWSPDDAPVFEWGPYWAFGVALNDDWQTPPFSDAAHWGPGYLPEDAHHGGAETTYGFCMLSFAADWSQRTAGKGLENRYLKRALALGRTSPDFPRVYHALTSRASQAAYDATGNAGGFIARLQFLGGSRKRTPSAR